MDTFSYNIFYIILGCVPIYILSKLWYFFFKLWVVNPFFKSFIIHFLTLFTVIMTYGYGYYASGFWQNITPVLIIFLVDILVIFMILLFSSNKSTA